MRAYKGFTVRNILVFFRSRQSVFFSLLSPLIVFGLYVTFLRDTYVDSIEQSLGALKTLVPAGEIRCLCSGLLLTGVIGSSIITVPFGTLQIIVEDRERGRDRDVLATPVRRWQVIFGYFTASALCALCITFVLLSGGLLVLSRSGSLYWTGRDLASLYGLTALGTISSTAISMALMLAFRSTSACGAFQGILSAAAGFVIGAYIPVAQFSSPVQTFCNLWPASGICCLLRRSAMSGLLAHMDRSIGGVDQGAFAASIREVFGFEVRVGGSVLKAGTILGYVLVVSAVCVVIDAAVYARIYKRK